VDRLGELELLRPPLEAGNARAERAVGGEGALEQERQVLQVRIS
jgi:hypothetical protein